MMGDKYLNECAFFNSASGWFRVSHYRCRLGDQTKVERRISLHSYRVSNDVFRGCLVEVIAACDSVRT